MPVDQIPLLSQLPEDPRSAILRILLVVLAIALIWLSRRLIAWLLIRPLRWLVERSPSEIDNLVVDAAVGPTRLIVIAVALVLGAQILIVSESISVLIQSVSRTLLIVAVFLLVYRLVDIMTPTSSRLHRLTGLSVQERLLPFARTAAKLVILAVGLVIVVQEWGYDVSGIIAGLGLFGLAFSLAAKDTAENLFGFTAIVGDSPFHVGEHIRMADIEGVVERVGIRSTRIRQPDQSLVTVPNSRLVQTPVLNWSRLSKRWYNTTIGIAYPATSENLRQLIARIHDILNSREKVDKDTILVRFTDFGKSALNIQVSAYIGLSSWVEFTAEKEIIHLAIMDAVTELGLTITAPG